MLNKVLVIAEAGVNHNGSLSRAVEMIKSAKAAGADVVKFQTFKAEELVTKSAQMADYQIVNTQQTTSQFEMLKQLELSEKDFRELKKVCDSEGIEFLSTGFDIESMQFLDTLGLKRWKIPSGEITNLPYLEWLGRKNVEIIFSTGMATFEEIAQAKDVLCRAGTNENKLTVLHCTTDYPAPLNAINLKAMQTIGQALKIKYGYSDHSKGISVSTAAVALGAIVIEKHFTLDKKLPGPDHAASLEVPELKSMIDAIRDVEICLGSSNKSLSEAEIANRLVARKSIVARRMISKGQMITADDITTKRPGSGLSPMLWYTVVGSKALRDYQKDEVFEKI